MKLLWVFLICLKEAQPANVHVNVKVKANANNKDIESPQPVLGDLLPDVLPSGPELKYRSQNKQSDQSSLASSSKGAEPTLSSRRLYCQSALWTKECEEGTVVLKTVKKISEKVCDLMCKDMARCKCYFFEEKSGDCCLTTLTEGTTTSNGISGPELPSIKPQKMYASRSKSGHTNDDCSEFHFEECSIPDGNKIKLKFNQEFEQDRQTMYYQLGKEERHICRRKCSQGTAGGWCNAYGFKSPSDNSLASCALHDYFVDDYIHYNCDVVTGRADRIDPQKYQSCVFRGAETTISRKKCRSGYCDLEHFGEMISQQYSADEIDCMRICSDTRGDEDPSKICTHFKYYPSKQFKAMNEQTNGPISNSPNEGQCKMYYVDPAKDHPSYKCDMVVEDKQSTEFNCRQPIKPNKGYVEVNSPSTTERATTSTTTIKTTTEKSMKTKPGHCLPHQHCNAGDCCALATSCNTCPFGFFGSDDDCGWKGNFQCKWQ